MPHQILWINIGEYNQLNEIQIEGYKVIEIREALFERGVTRKNGRATHWKVFNNHNNSLENTGGENQMLWLMEKGLKASTTFETSSSAIAFIMHGDHNDGVANFHIDAQYVCSIDLYEAQNKALIVNGLDDTKQHTLEVEVTGQKNKLTKGDHAHICAGFALKPTINITY